MIYTPESARALKCSFCALPFTDSVKQIPACRSLICGQCYSDLRKSLNVFNAFKCRACAKTHILPVQGLSDERELMIQLGRRLMSAEEKRLEAAIAVVNDRLARLKTFNKHEMINSYCDTLEIQVNEAIVSAVLHVNKLGTELLNQINIYRSELLDSNPVEPDTVADSFRPNSAKRCRDECVKVEPESPTQRGAKTAKDLSQLSAEIEMFSQSWKNYFANMDADPCEAKIANAQQQADEFEKEAVELERKMTTRAFNGRFLRFQEVSEFFRSQTLLGSLLIEGSLQEDVNREFAEPLLKTCSQDEDAPTNEDESQPLDAVKEKIEKILAAMRDSEEKIQSLDSFDEKKEINAYCELLLEEVTLRLHTTIKSVNQRGEDLFKQIGEYRKQLIESGDSKRPAKRQKLSKDAPQTQQVQKRLSNKIRKFNEKWTDFFAQIDPSISLEKAEGVLKQAEKHCEELTQLRATMMSETFNGRFMKLQSPQTTVNLLTGNLIFSELN